MSCGRTMMHSFVEENGICTKGKASNVESIVNSLLAVAPLFYLQLKNKYGIRKGRAKK